MNPDLELTEENLGSPTVLITVVENAARRNKWRVLGSAEAAPTAGYVQHGIALIERDGKTVYDSDVRFATTQWARRGEGVVHFENSNYDMTREDAFADFIERAKKLPR